MFGFIPNYIQQYLLQQYNACVPSFIRIPLKRFDYFSLQHTDRRTDLVRLRLMLIQNTYTLWSRICFWYVANFWQKLKYETSKNRYTCIPMIRLFSGIKELCQLALNPHKVAAQKRAAAVPQRALRNFGEF